MEQQQQKIAILYMKKIRRVVIFLFSTKQQQKKKTAAKLRGMEDDIGISQKKDVFALISSKCYNKNEEGKIKGEKLGKI